MDKKIRERVYDKYNGHCSYCGKEITIKEMQIDHIFPKYIRNNLADYINKWGIDKVRENYNDCPEKLNDINNLNPSCAACNRRKGTLSIDAFRRELELCHDRMLRNNANYRQLFRFGQIELKNEGRIKFYYEKCKADK